MRCSHAPALPHVEAVQRREEFLSVHDRPDLDSDKPRTLLRGRAVIRSASGYSSSPG